MKKFEGIIKGKKPSKKLLIELAVHYAGVVTDIADACGVARMTVYRWMDKDPDFKAQMDDQNTVLVNLAIKGLRYNLENNSERSVHYTLDRLARDKGFGSIIKIQDKSKFEDQFEEMSDSELEDLLIRTTKRIKNG
jgi:hypothetical protein